MSGHLISATAMIRHYLNMLINIQQTQTHIALVQRGFKDHFQMNGPDITFPITIEYLHNFLEQS